MPSIRTRFNRRIRPLHPLPVVAAALVFAVTGWGATFGTVVPIGGHAADIALDEARGVIYVANYTANRIDVVSIKNRVVQSSMNVAKQPASLALSPDGRYLLVAHYADFQSGSGTPSNTLTVLDLSGNGNLKQTFSFGAPPLGVAFGNNGLALVATKADLLLFDPATGFIQAIDTVLGVGAKALPVASGTFPREVISASLATCGDGTCIWGTLGGGDQQTELLFKYDVQSRQVGKVWISSSPPPGPRVISTNREGTVVLSNWGIMAGSGYYLLAEFPDAWGNFSIGSHVIDSARGLIYAQIPRAQTKEAPISTCTTIEGVEVCVTKPGTLIEPVDLDRPTLMITDVDNLTVRERLKLAENLTGKSVLSSKGDYMYAGSDSGVMFLPVGLLNQQRRVMAAQEDVVFRGTWCDRRILTQELNIVDPGGNKTDFQIVDSATGAPLASGTTPARVQVPIDMSRYQNTQGTAAMKLEIRSNLAVNIPPPVRILINNREPDQRGTFFNVPGELVDILADPARNRFYILRQDKNQVLVFDATNYRQIATLRTGNVPTSMAITADRQFLITGANDSQVAHVFNLDTLQFDHYIVFPPGHYPRSIAASSSSILAAARVAGPKHKIDRVEIWGMAFELPSLGVFENDIHVNTVLSASPSGATIMAAQPDGKVYLYDAAADTFVISRKDYDKLGGAFAALSDELYVVDNYVMNRSLVPVQAMETGSGGSSGFAMADTFYLRTAAPTSSSPGVVQRIDTSQLNVVRPTRMAEAPLLPNKTCSASSAFVRTLAPLPNRQAIISLTTSGFTVLPWNYDVAVADPRISSVVNAADRSASVAPGGLISVFGRDLSPVNAASSQLPLPTALGDSCLTVNGALVPMVLVSPTQINGQLPFGVNGHATMILRTPTGISNSFSFDVQPNAPGVFRASLPGMTGEVPTVVRALNNELVTAANPVHPDDFLVIYLTGLGAVFPEVLSGMPGPEDPLALALVKPAVTLGGVELPVWYAGLVPDQVGVYQINVQVPFKGVPTGMDIPLTITQGAGSTTINVRVVQ